MGIKAGRDWNVTAQRPRNQRDENLFGLGLKKWEAFDRFLSSAKEKLSLAVRIDVIQCIYKKRKLRSIQILQSETVLSNILGFAFGPRLSSCLVRRNFKTNWNSLNRFHL